MLDREKKRATWRRYYRRTYKAKAADDPVIIRRRDYGKKWRAVPERQQTLREYQWRYRERHKFRNLVRQAILRARAGGIEYDVPYLHSLRETRPGTCECCGAAFHYGRGTNRRPHPATPSLDRIDPAKGYIAGNVGVICWRCNAIKRDATAAELEAIVLYVRKRLLP